MKKANNKVTDARRKHTEMRSIERYGITLNTKKQKEIIKMIHSNLAKLIWKESLSRTHYEVLYEGKIIHTVYSRKCRTLLTVLPPQSQNACCPESEALDDRIRKTILGKIEHGNAHLIEQVDGHISRVGIIINNKLLIIFFDSERKKIINEAEVKTNLDRIFW